MRALFARRYPGRGLASPSNLLIALEAGLGVAIAAVASSLIVAANTFTSVFYLAQMTIVVNLLGLTAVFVSAVYCGAFSIALGLLEPSLLHMPGVAYTPLTVIGGYVAWHIVQRRFRYRINAMLGLQMLFLFVVMISVARSGGSMLGGTVRVFFIENVLAFLVCQAFVHDEKRLEQLLICFGLFSALLGLLAYLQVPGVLAGTARIQLWGRGAILVGRWAGRGLIFALVGGLAIFRTKGIRVLSLLASLALTLIVVVSNQRGPLLAAILAWGAIGLGLGLVRHLEGKRRIVILFGGLSLLLIVVSVPLVLNWGSRHVDLLAVGWSDRGISERQRIYQDAWQQFLQYPLWGGGFGSFASATGWIYAHNIFLEIAADLGGVGLGVFAAMLLLALYYAYRLLRSPEAQRVKPSVILVLGLLALDLAGAQTSADLSGNKQVWFDMGALTALYVTAFGRRWQDKWPG